MRKLWREKDDAKIMTRKASPSVLLHKSEVTYRDTGVSKKSEILKYISSRCTHWIVSVTPWLKISRNTSSHGCTDFLKIVYVEILLKFGNHFQLHYNCDFVNFFKELYFFITKYAPYCFSFYRPIRFSQSPEPFIQLKNRYDPLYFTVII